MSDALSWDRLEDGVLVGLEEIQEMECQLETKTKDRQMSYVNAHPVDRSYDVAIEYCCG